MAQQIGLWRRTDLLTFIRAVGSFSPIDMGYSKILRRLREGKTNYKKRGSMLMGRRDFVTVHISNENTMVQIHRPEMGGDKVLASAHSRSLISKGWKGSRKNIPAAYLTGYLAGKKALGHDSTEAIMYSGTRRYTDRMAAALKGVRDAGMKMPADDGAFPPDTRINGEHLKAKNDISQFKAQIDGEAI